MMKLLVSLLRKIFVLLIGVPILLLGIILVPLPGPGLLIMFAGLFIIALEFSWAQKYVDQIQAKVQSLLQKAKQRSQINRRKP